MYLGINNNPVVMKQNRRAVAGLSSQSGVSLLIIIISILVLGVLGAAMYAITSTSYFNQASSQGAMKAMYIAESGVRIAGSEFKAAASGSKNTTLATLDGKAFSLPGGGGQFTVKLYPYWFVVNTAYTPGGTITLKLPGSMPLLNKDATNAISLPATGSLKVMNRGNVAVYSSFTLPSYTLGSGTTVTFTLSTPFSQGITAGEEAFLVVAASSTNPSTISKNGDLILDNSTGAAQIFPPENGTFSIKLPVSYGIKHFKYKKRSPEVVAGGEATITLQNIDDLNPINGYFSSFASLAKADILEVYLGNNLGIQSTAVIGQ